MKKLIATLILLISTFAFASDNLAFIKNNYSSIDLKIILPNTISEGCDLQIDSLFINQKEWTISFDVSVNNNYCSPSGRDSEITTTFDIGSYAPSLNAGSYLLIINGEVIGTFEVGAIDVLNRGIETGNGFHPIGPMP